MAIADAGHRRSRWDAVMHQLACWLVRHLDDPKLLLWLIKRGGQLHDQLVWLIERRIDDLDKLASSGNTTELDRHPGERTQRHPRPGNANALAFTAQWTCEVQNARPEHL
jgi:hypothetical protein